MKAYFDAKDRIRDIGPLESRGYVAARREGRIGGGKRRSAKEGKDGTIRRELVVLVAAANHAVKWGRLPMAESPRVELPTVHKDSRVRWLTKEQLREALHRAANGWVDDEGEMHTSDADLHDFVILAYYTGARRRSIENLPIPAHPATYSGDIRPLIPEYPATWARHRWVMSLMSAFVPFVKHGAGRPGSPQEGPARGAK